MVILGQQPHCWNQYFHPVRVLLFFLRQVFFLRKLGSVLKRLAVLHQLRNDFTARYAPLFQLVDIFLFQLLSRAIIPDILVILSSINFVFKQFFFYFYNVVGGFQNVPVPARRADCYFERSKGFSDGRSYVDFIPSYFNSPGSWKYSIKYFYQLKRIFSLLVTIFCLDFSVGGERTLDPAFE